MIKMPFVFTVLVFHVTSNSFQYIFFLVGEGGGFYSRFNTFGGGFYPWFIFLFCRPRPPGGRRVGVGVLRSGSFIRYSRRE